MIRKEAISPFLYANEITGMLQPGMLLNTNGDKFNSMVIGWGQLGVLWSRPVFTVYVRQSRYTKAQLDNTGAFTVSVPLGGPMEKELFRVCGSLSGRDVDKVDSAKLDLVPPETNGVPGIRQYPLTIECKVLYSQRQELEKIPEDIIETFYPESLVGFTEFDMRDPHTTYIGRIVDAYIIK